MFVAEAYAYGVGADPLVSLEHYRRACSLGSLDGCVKVGRERGEKDVVAVTVNTWEPACAKGSYWGCYLAGFALARDQGADGRPRDIARGRVYLEDACVAQYLPACYEVAALVVELGETSSFPIAKERLVHGCRLRERDSCHYLGLADLQGVFGAANERAAMDHFWRACYDGLGKSCFALAYLYKERVAAPRTLDTATKLVVQACLFGYAPACEAMKHPDLALPAPEGVPR